MLTPVPAIPVSLDAGTEVGFTQTSRVSAPGICKLMAIPAFTTSSTPSNFNEDGLGPFHPLILSDGKLMLLSIPLFPKVVRSDHVIFVVVFIATRPIASMFVALYSSTFVTPLLLEELLDDTAPLELLDDDDELELDELDDELLELDTKHVTSPGKNP